MNLLKSCTLFIYLFFTYSSSSAEVFDEKLLFKKGDWEVALLRYDDRSTACIARNGLGNKEFQIYVNADVDEFAIFYDNSNMPFVYFFDSIEHLNQMLSSLTIKDLIETSNFFIRIRFFKIKSCCQSFSPK